MAGVNCTDDGLLIGLNLSTTLLTNAQIDNQPGMVNPGMLSWQPACEGSMQIAPWHIHEVHLPECTYLPADLPG